MRLMPLFLVAVSLALTACVAGAFPGAREGNARALALPVHMIPRVVDAGAFTLQSYERIGDRGNNGTAVIYIEGTADASLPNPTPIYPAGLALATRDSSTNVIYLARPCQYRAAQRGAETCDARYVQGAMFAPEVIAAYERVLDDLKSRYGVAAFHVVGQGSGGGLAAILAAKRVDILSLRTVSGLLDTQTYARAVRSPYDFSASINPINTVPQLRHKPQHHYVGQFDRVVPNAVYHSFAQAFADTRCLKYTFIDNVDHVSDVVGLWPAHARQIPTCVGDDPRAVERDARAREMAPKIAPKK